MAHFAKVNPLTLRVDTVIVADQSYIDSLPNSEIYVQTSYNTRGGVHYDQNGAPDDEIALRKNFASKNSVYDPKLDAFYIKKPYDSWILNTETCLWEPPVQKPNDEKHYIWNEDTISWDECDPPTA